MSLPLEGIRVVDAAQIFAGPGAAMYLADQGAEVIKLEPPGGEGCRYLYTSDKAPFGKSFLVLNRNKRSIVVDLEHAGGREVLHRLASWADVFISSLLPDAAQRLEADYKSLSRINPRLVYAAISAYGNNGPEAGKPGYDLVLQARAGIVASRRDGEGAPVTPHLMVSDLSCSMLLPYAIMTALWERQSTGCGRQVDISLLGMAVAIQAQQLVQVQGDETALPGAGVSATASAYRCSDDSWLMVVVLTTRQWEAWCKVLGLEHLTKDPAFATYDDRSKMSPELAEIVAAVFATRPRGEWLSLLEEAGIPCGPVMEREEVFRDQQMQDNQIMIALEQPQLGQVEMLGFPFTMSDQDVKERLRSPAPLSGQHTREVLAELGYSNAEADTLVAANAVEVSRA